MTMLNLKAVATLLILLVVLAGLVFASAGTLHYWQDWTFLLVYFAASLAITLGAAAIDSYSDCARFMVRTTGDCSDSGGADLAASR